MTVRTRFAPSPTGFLHIGGARTALYSWLFARHHQGIFILRIEDTDRERSTQESIDAILESMEWLGLNYDEGPYYQTKHFDRYREVAEELLKEKKAYRCYCTKERLETLRTQQMANKEKPRYDGYCRTHAPKDSNQSFVIRFLNPESGVVSFEDQVRGTLTFQNSELDDLIIVRSDGVPTYNFTVVVDDYDMKITHVIRGDDHINNTPRQINILKALNAEPPLYAHLPMILGPDGKRFSKRHGAEGVMQYREEGYLPEALLNYLVRLGWSHGDQEVFSREEMIRWFDLKNISKSPAMFNPEKLLWLNQYYFKNGNREDIARQLVWQFNQMGVDIHRGPALTDIVKAQAERAKTLKEMAEKSRFFYEENIVYDQKTAAEHLTPEILPLLTRVTEQLQSLSEWNEAAIHAVITQTAENLGLKMGKIAQPIRVAMTGNTISPPIDATLYLLGKQQTLARLNRAIEFIASLG